ncbi:acetate/propionate family kinase [Zhongshania borealis]|uniref:Acetate kinase n=1 Tax=Zhongshania borealis TaxID=889488 RepID=A0ABP7W7U0_9GAMM
MILTGKIDRIGLSDTRLNAKEILSGKNHSCDIDGTDHARVAAQLLKWLNTQARFCLIQAVGHRLVHGMNLSDATLITPSLLAELKEAAPYDPEHLPLEIALIEACIEHYPSLQQVACFDSVFHHGMPRVASQLPLPRHYEEQGLRRYGYHGLSCEYLMQELHRLGDPAAVSGRVILAHLGNGASMTAVLAGQSVDTSMGFTPSSGMMMGTRSGDMDPGVAVFLSRSGQLDSEQFYTMVNHESGLLGVSGRSSDVRELLAIEADDVPAAEAIALFCYQAAKLIGAYSAALGGLDTLVFAGGIGENSPQIRKRICGNLGFLGITLNRTRNLEATPIISADCATVKVRVIATNEEIIMVHSVKRVLKLDVIQY